MRQLLIQVPRGQGDKVLDMAKAHQGTNLARFEASDTEEPIDFVITYVPNRQVEQLLEALDTLPDLHVTIVPRGMMPLKPPPSEAPQQVKEVELRSPLEIFLAGLQSVGSWTGFLGYAACAGVVVWIGLFTNTIYLLTAAMLIAPFAGPAMNTAIATARGDLYLLKRSVIRYGAGIAVTVLVAGILSVIMQQQAPTSLMMASFKVSSVTILLPLIAGTAGALNLIQSERSSLVSGAAVGVLVAASLAPAAGLVGMAAAIARWDMVVNSLFLLVLQLAGINFSGAIVFRLVGLSATGARYNRGKRWLFPVGLGIGAVIMAGLLTAQLWQEPTLQRTSLEQRTSTEIQQVVQESDLAKLVQSNVQFTRTKIEGQNTLLTIVYVQRNPEVTASTETIQTQLTEAIQTHLLEQDFNVTPLVQVTVLELPDVSRK
ncbi:MAG: DUF389 domain-containing protein [Coleofasciculus sp. B1-GNL1-01]|uniref:DUF389 domain-containing protein n=1 Tax=Coleofasciculus sp. B1-GNL1-01 TaxID=3068484 RepID=UPI0032F99197